MSALGLPQWHLQHLAWEFIPNISNLPIFFPISILISKLSPPFGFAPRMTGTSTATLSITTVNHRTLTDLPDELLLQILKSLPAQRDLHALCLVSRRLHTVFDPVLYKSISFEQPHHHIAFSESLNHRPRRGSLIQEVRLEYPGHELDEIISLADGSYQLDNFSHSVSRMSNLENLEISVPASLLHGIGTLFNGPFDLACLKTCELSFIFGEICHSMLIVR